MAYDFSRKHIIYLIRLLVVIVMAYFIIFAPDNGNKYAGYAFIAFYLSTCLLVYYIPQHYFYSERLLFVFVLFDTSMIGMGIYLSGMAGTDLYLIYFFIICLAALGYRFGHLMVSVIIFAVVYGGILYNQGYLTGEMAASYLLRLPFIVVIAMFFGYLASMATRDSKSRLVETERQYRLLFDYSDVFVFTVNPEAELLSANPKMYLQHGFSNEIEILGMPHAELYDRKETEIFARHLNTVFETCTSVEYEIFEKRFDNWVSHVLSPIKDPENGNVFAVSVVSKDITERVKKEMELQKAYDTLRQTRDQLIQKDKMASLGRLASGIAHEIRNPMEIILMGMDYLENNISKENKNHSRAIDRIYAAVDRVNRIINDILKFSRKAEFVIETVGACALVNEIVGLASHNIAKNNIEVKVLFPRKETEVAANRNMLEQVLLNLINNAVDAMEATDLKTLTICIYQVKVKEVGYKTGYRKADYFKIGDQMVVIEIVDTGKGMDEDVLIKLFEPFFTTKESGKGTGLGLSLALMIMDRMKGTIDVESSAGEGSKFFVKLQTAENMKNIMGNLIDEPETQSIDY